ncbi:MULTISPECIES: DNA adenine methylase [spotted fever group]|uniref:site-specific DNA-methyltransferase (adenine-specific) n=4 Tax=spotted fever group TaxID=114277 RepID=A0A510GBY1_9RICK|nr:MULTISPECIES: DNA adenine methylase [spotted fever group]BBJ32444.1 hypothetical protein RAS_p400 [Rickettsia asiatica]
MGLRGWSTGICDITKKASTLFEYASNTEVVGKNVECIATPHLYHPSLKLKPLEEIDKEIPRPFVKWVGGKRSLRKAISVRMPTNFKDYYEPFLGGGAIFFKLQPNRAFISDLNLDLIITYKVVRDEPLGLIKLLSEHKANHSKDYYYEVRKSSI